MNYHTSTVGVIGIESANELDDNAKARDARGRVVTDIFTQPVGEGLLKFKVTLTPADPAANNSIPFSLELGYEYSLLWRIDGKRMQGRLVPNRDSPFEPARPTPLDALVMDRYYHRREGPATTPAINLAVTDVNNGNQQINEPRHSHQAINPFTNNTLAGAEPQRSPNDMDVDIRPSFTFAQHPKIRAYVEHKQKDESKRGLNECLRDNAWQAEDSYNNNHHNSNKKQKQNDKNEGKNNSNNNRGDGGGRARGNSRGRGWGRGRRRGRGRDH